MYRVYHKSRALSLEKRRDENRISPFQFFNFFIANLCSLSMLTYSIFFSLPNNVETNLSIKRYVVCDIFNGRSRSPHPRNLFAAARPFCAPSNANVGRRGRGYRISPLATHSFRDHDISPLPCLSSSCLSRVVLDRHSIRPTIVREKAQLSRNISAFGRDERTEQKKKGKKGKRKARKMKQKKRERKKACI